MHQVREYSHILDTSPGPCPKYIANEKRDYQPARHVSAEFVGSASNLHEEAYQTPSLEDLGTDSIDHSFYLRDNVYDPKDSSLQHVEANETNYSQDVVRYRNRDFMHDHSRDGLDPEIGDFNHDSSNVCNQKKTPEIYAWSNGGVEKDLYEHYCLQNEAIDECRQDLQGGGFNVLAYADNSTRVTIARSCLQPELLLSEDSIDPDFRNFWRPRRWT